jgi:hypothetical protein
MTCSLGGADGDPGAPTINVKNVNGGVPGPHWGSGLYPGYERCVVTCIDMIGKK